MAFSRNLRKLSKSLIDVQLPQAKKLTAEQKQ
jgi:3-methyladenine DNA glycosylase AlkC